jgi:O-antigen ligase
MKDRFFLALGIILVATYVVVFSNTFFFESKFSMMERGLGILAISLFYKLLVNSPSPIKVPTFMAALVIVSGLSIFAFLQSYRIEDFIGYAAAFLSAVVFVSIFELKILINSISLGFALIMIWSFTLLFTDPASWNTYGQFQGPFVHYNLLGFAMLLSIPSFLFVRTPLRLLTLLLRISLIFGALSLILLSASRTSLIALIAVLIAYISWHTYQRNKAIGLSFLLFSFVSFVLILLNANQVLLILGKDDTLSSRTLIWNSLSDHLTDSPLIGFGWSRLFTPESPIATIASSETGFFVSHSHNDLLHWYVTTGIFGALLIVANVLFISILALRSLRPTNFWPLWVLLVVLALIVTGTTEISTFQLQGWYVLSLISAVAVNEFYRSDQNKKNRFILTIPSSRSIKLENSN